MSSNCARAVREANIPLKKSQFPVKLEHVLGFTSISNSAVTQTKSTIAYGAVSTTILYNKNTRKQDFIICNACRAITSISFSPGGRYLATGEKGHDPKIRIWDLTGDRTSCIELGDHKFAINCVCFSTKPGYLVSIGSEDDGYICVWNLKNKTKLASNKCLVPIYGIVFAEDGSRFVTIGHHHVKFWNFIPKTTDSVSPLLGNEPILGEHKLNFFIDVVCGRQKSLTLITSLSDNTVRFWSFNYDEVNLDSASSQTDNTINETLTKIIYLNEDNSKQERKKRIRSVVKVGGLDGNIHIFDALKNYQLITTFADHSAIVTAVRFTLSPITFKLGLISASADKSLIFQTISKNENGIYQFARLRNIFEHYKFHNLAIDHQRDRIYTTCRDRIIRIEVCEPLLQASSVIETPSELSTVSSETELTNEESFVLMIGPKENESVLSDEDGDTISNERASSFRNENDDLEHSTIDTPVNNLGLQHRQLSRKNIISLMFRQQSIEKIQSDTPWIEVNEAENHGFTPIQANKNTIFEAFPSESSTNPKNSDDTVDSLDDITQDIVPLPTEQVGSSVPVVDPTINDDRMSILLMTLPMKFLSVLTN
ncbi:hypothetical protein I4U23_004947 [Adineta vaga]|nr:hypothetical protein I4U23_004947 [Adineta vaga]